MVWRNQWGIAENPQIWEIKQWIYEQPMSQRRNQESITAASKFCVASTIV